MMPLGDRSRLTRLQRLQVESNSYTSLLHSPAAGAEHSCYFTVQRENTFFSLACIHIYIYIGTSHDDMAYTFAILISGDSGVLREIYFIHPRIFRLKYFVTIHP